jgi:SAM-dependent methyltransferase
MEGLDRSSAHPSTECCGPSLEVDPRIARHFDHGVARRLAAGDEFLLQPISRRLLSLLGSPAGATILEVGSGPGSLAMALLIGGAEQHTGIDLSPQSLALAERRATQAGFADRTAFRLADGAATALEPHDWVVLDRALCCYRDLDRLMSNTIAAAGRRYAFSVPESRGPRGILNRIVIWLENVTKGLRGRPCPGFVHDLGRIERRLNRAGFRRTGEARSGLWYAALYERAPQDAAEATG